MENSARDADVAKLGAMTHGRVTAQQMEDKVQIVRVMTHGRVTDISEK